MDYQDVISVWQSRQIRTAADIACEMNGNGVAFIYHSAKIENDRITYHDTREIFDHGGVRRGIPEMYAPCLRFKILWRPTIGCWMPLRSGSR